MQFMLFSVLTAKLLFHKDTHPRSIKTFHYLITIILSDVKHLVLDFKYVCLKIQNSRRV